MLKHGFVFLAMLFLLFLDVSIALGEWELKFEEEMWGRTIEQVHFISPMDGWAIAAGEEWAFPDGDIYWTKDRGNTWLPMKLDILPQAFFLNSHDGWQSAHDIAKNYIEGAYPPKDAKFAFERSFDGGLTWIEMSGIVTEVVEISRPPVPDKMRIFRTDGISMFYFLDSQTGFMAVPSLIYGTPDTPDAFSAYCIGKTTDGGETWTLQIHWRFGNPLYTRKIVFFDTQNGWIMSHGMLYHTTDAGNTWDFDLGEPGPGERGELISIEPASPNEYWLSHSTVNSNRLSHTTDSGESWQIVLEIPSGGVFSDILFVNPQEGWVTLGGMAGVPSLGLGDFNGIIHTKDGGKNWEVDLKVASREVPVSLRNLTYDSLTRTLWATGGYSMIYRRMEIPTGIRPQGKFPSTWGRIRHTEKED